MKKCDCCGATIPAGESRHVRVNRVEEEQYFFQTVADLKLCPRCDFNLMALVKNKFRPLPETVAA